jgi:circadian clock protein KaiB
MASTEKRAAQERFEQAIAALEAERYALTLFVSGASLSSARAIANVREICDEHLSGRYQLSIVDLNQEPALAKRHHVLATPTLVKERPLPLRMLVGDMSAHERVLRALGVSAAGRPPAQAADPVAQVSSG